MILGGGNAFNRRSHDNRQNTPLPELLFNDRLQGFRKFADHKPTQVQPIVVPE
jgi:hypothetical protein